MAQYPAPIYEETFNIENFSNLNSFQYLYSVAKTNISNSFTAAQTFLNQVFIDGILAVRDLSLTNLTPVANKTYSVTLLISSASSKFYANTLTVNGTAATFIYNGGSAAISVSSATYIIQQFNIIYTASTSAPAFVISSIGQAF